MQRAWTGSLETGTQILTPFPSHLQASVPTSENSRTEPDLCGSFSFMSFLPQEYRTRRFYKQTNHENERTFCFPILGIYNWRSKYLISRR